MAARLDTLAHRRPVEAAAAADLSQESEALRRQVELLEQRLRKRDEQRRALLHIMSDLNDINRRLGDQRKAMLHILGDYEQDRSRLARQTERLDNSRRALLHILQDSHQSNLRLENSRKAMIHIMDDLRETTIDVQTREHELRDKQEQLVQAGKLATLGELTTGVAHELNNPLNNIGLFVGNAIDLIQLGRPDTERVLRELDNAMRQVGKATQIISHLRTFGRAAPVSREAVLVNEVIERSLSLMREQFRLREIEIRFESCPENPTVIGNAIQLEQVFINLLANARDAVAESERKLVRISCLIRPRTVELTFQDSGPGIPAGLEQRIFDPFFTTKEVGAGTGLGLSITYGIVKEHDGSIAATNVAGSGAALVVELPLSDGPGAVSADA